MTMVNLCVRRDRAMIGVDTGVVNLEDDTTMGKCAISKLLVLAHTNVVVSGRGHAAFISSVGLMCMMSVDGRLDALDAQMPYYMENATRMLSDKFAADLKSESRAADLSRQEIFILGWSDSSKRMKAVSFSRTSMLGTIERDEYLGDEADKCPAYRFAPYETTWGEPPVHPERANDFLSLAKWQAAQADAFNPNEPGTVAGNCVVATAMSDRVEIRTIGAITATTPVSLHGFTA